MWTRCCHSPWAEKGANRIEELVKRINELARKAKTTGLTPEETAERDLLRQQYIAAVRRNLTAQLENTYIVEPDGTKHKLGRRETEEKEQ